MDRSVHYKKKKSCSRKSRGNFEIKHYIHKHHNKPHEFNWKIKIYKYLKCLMKCQIHT